ncbi:hypothetical protein, partial [Escherichia coli]|uniref:hypothetical protein n=1 Tax=Escherichia coli TaxID=562 RepID=UPI001CA3F1AF
WKGWAIFLRQKQKKLIMLPSEILIWQPEFTDKTLSRKPGAVHRHLIYPVPIATHQVVGRGIIFLFMGENLAFCASH